jgi:hypothetical protein
MVKIKNSLKHIIISLAMFLVMLIIFAILGYIDGSVITKIYLPIIVVVLLAHFLRQFYAGHIILSSAIIGLSVEYAISTSRDNPNMGGAFANTAIIILGVVVAVFIQYKVNKKKKEKKQVS